MNGGEHGEREPLPEVRAEDVLSRAMPGGTPYEAEGDTYQVSGEVGEAEPEPPRIYVASLSDCNAGRLHGAWLDAAVEVDDLHAGIRRILAASPAPDAEEWAIHDYMGFGPLRLSEYESLELVSEAAQGIVEHGEAFAAFVEVAERDPDRFPLFEQLYRGKWASVEAYAESLLGWLDAEHELAQLPEWLRPHVSVDVQSFTLDLETSASVITSSASEGGVYVFDFDA